MGVFVVALPKHIVWQFYLGHATNSQIGPLLPTYVFPSGQSFASMGQAFILVMGTRDFVGDVEGEINTDGVLIGDGLRIMVGEGDGSTVSVMVGVSWVFFCAD